MNITSINGVTINFLSKNFNHFLNLTPAQKKIATLAIGIFSCIALVYYCFRFCSCENVTYTEKELDNDHEQNLKIESEKQSTEIILQEDDVNVPINEMNIFGTNGLTRKVFSSGLIEIGNFVDGNLEGEATRLFPDPIVEELTEFEETKSIRQNPLGIRRETGTFNKGNLIKGKVYFFDRRVYEGNFVNGHLVEGIKWYVKKTECDFEKGKFENDQLTKSEIYYQDLQIQVIHMIGNNTAEIYRLDVRSNEKIGDLKKKVVIHSGYHEDQQRLIFAGEQLADDKTLEDYHIFNSSALFMVPRLRGD